MDISSIVSKLKSSELLLSSMANLLLKPISMFLSLLYTPILFGYLGSEQYGVWITILSVVNWMNYCDIGIGTGLRNLLARELAEEKYEEAKRSVATSYICLSGISLIILFFLLISLPFISWNSLLGTSIRVKMPLFFTFIFICINFILALCNTVLYAVQKSESVSLRSIFAQLINVIGVLVLSQITSPSLIYISILFGCSTSLTYIATTVSLWKKYDFFRVDLKSFQNAKVKKICNVGIKFFIIQISFVVMYTVDNILITNFFGAEAATPYSMVNRTFEMIYSIFAAVLLPVWSRTTTAMAKNDYKWIHNTKRNMLLLWAMFAVIFVSFSFVFKPLMSLWLGQELVYENGLVLLICIYYIGYSFCGVYSQLLNGLSIVNGMVFLGIVQGLFNIPLSIYFSVYCGMGVVGIKLATTILIFVGVLFEPLYFEYSMKKIASKNVQESL